MTMSAERLAAISAISAEDRTVLVRAAPATQRPADVPVSSM
jgi:hypothetical protein